MHWMACNIGFTYETVHMLYNIIITVFTITVQIQLEGYIQIKEQL